MSPGTLLALDTSTEAGCVAVGSATQVLAEVSTGVRAQRSDTVLPTIDFALRCAGVEAADLTAVVVGAGPGSFTGLRIAAATAKAFAHTLDVPLFAYSSLLCLAAGGAQADRPVCAVLDARRGDVYAACYRFPGMRAVETVMEPAARSVAELRAHMADVKPLYVGRWALDNRHDLEQAGGMLAPAHWARPRAGTLLWLAEACPRAGRVAEPARWSPTYHRAAAVRRARPAG